MAVYQHCRNCHGIFILECFDNHRSRLFFIVFLDFMIAHQARAGNLTIKVIAVGSSHRLDSQSCLCKRCRPAAVRMNDTATLRKCLIQFQMRQCIRGRLPLSFHNLAGQIHQNNVFCCHLIIGHTGRFNRHIAGFPVNRRHISSCQCH